MDFLYIGASLAGSAPRWVTEGGTRYLVAPVVMCREGVLNSELVSAQVLAESLNADTENTGTQFLTNLWEGLPVTLGHPQEGLPVGETLAWLKEQQVGIVRNVAMSGDALVGEVWLPAEQSDPLAAQTLAAIAASKVVEVSIGSWSMGVLEAGAFNGRKYAQRVLEISPNHLALLPNDTGACSVAAGCGTPRIAPTMNAARRTARRPTSSGVEIAPAAKLPRSKSVWGAAAQAATGESFNAEAPVGEWPKAAREWVADRTLLGNPDAATFEELLFFPVVNPTTDKLSRGALLAILGGRAYQAPATDAAKASARRVALELLGEAFGIPAANAAQIQPLAACACKEGAPVQVTFQVKGRRLAAVIREALAASGLEASTLATKVAAITDIGEQEVAAAVRGERDALPTEMVSAFAQVLGISSGLLYAVADEDLRDFLRRLNAEQPRGEAYPMGFSLRGMFAELFGKVKKVIGGSSQVQEKVKLLQQRYTLSDEQAEALGKMPEGFIEAAAKQLEQSNKQAAAGGEGQGGAPASGTGTTAGEGVAAQPLTWAQIEALMPPEMRASLAQVQASEAATKQELVGALQARKLGMSEQQLSRMDLDALRALEQGTRPNASVHGAGFLGAQGAPAPVTAESMQADPVASSPSPYAQWRKSA